MATLKYKNGTTWAELSILDLVYPVGSVYISYKSTSPVTLFGGAWSQVTNRVIRGAAGTGTGGNDSLTLTTANLPAHTHTVGIKRTSQELATVGLVATNPSFAGRVLIEGSPSGVTFTSSSVGSASSISRLPAYQNLYIWYRTA